MRSTLVLLLLLIPLGTAAGCAGDDESDTSATTEWATDFCTATLAWSDELQRIGEDVSDFTSLSRETIEEAGEQVGTATDTFVEAVRDLGGPDTDSGDAVESSLETLADEVEAEQAEIEDAIEEISGITGLTTAAREVAASAAAMFTALEQTLTAIEEADVDGEIETAFQEAEACDEITR
jgi:ABC-type transporter Mla subunit MlaD